MVLMFNRKTEKRRIGLAENDEATNPLITKKITRRAVLSPLLWMFLQHFFRDYAKIYCF
jgi:hypothetical protein